MDKSRKILFSKKKTNQQREFSPGHKLLISSAKIAYIRKNDGSAQRGILKQEIYSYCKIIDLKVLRM